MSKVEKIREIRPGEKLNPFDTTMETIGGVIKKLNLLIFSEESFSNIFLKCYIKGVKKYEWASYFEIYDDTGKISGTIQKNRINKPLKENSLMNIMGVLSVDKYNKAAINICDYEYLDEISKDRYQLVKEKLEEEKLLDFPRKEIGNNYKNIGLITSTNAAGLKDVLSILQKNMKNGKIIIYPTLVQGENMSSSIIKKIKQANLEKKCDILLIARGGGSKSDLEWFDDYNLARAVINSALPIVCGIGHEIDKNIVDLCVDKSFITPTDAAHKLTCGHLNNLEVLNSHIINYNHLVNIYSNKLSQYYNFYNFHKMNILNSYQINLKFMVNNYNKLCYKLSDKINVITQKYLSNNPRNILLNLQSSLNLMENKLNVYNLAHIHENIKKYRDNLDIIKNPKIKCGDEIINSSKRFNELKKENKNITIKFLDGEILL